MTKATPKPQPLPQTGGSYVLEKGTLKQTASTKPLVSKAIPKPPTSDSQEEA